MQGGVERIYIVNSLAGKRALLKQILIHVRDGSRVRVDARGACGNDGVTRAPGAEWQRSNSRLHDAVPTHDSLLLRIELCLVQRMTERRDELARGVARQLRVRIESDHVAYGRKQLRRSDHARE